MSRVNRSAPGKEESRDPYLGLVRRFPLRPIRSDGELDEAVAVVNSLLSRPRLAPGESDYLEVLSGKRALSRAHVGKLARFFRVSPGAFAF